MSLHICKVAVLDRTNLGISNDNHTARIRPNHGLLSYAMLPKYDGALSYTGTVLAISDKGLSGGGIRLGMAGILVEWNHLNSVTEILVKLRIRRTVDTNSIHQMEY
jgi:hypothetical protein